MALPEALARAAGMLRCPACGDSLGVGESGSSLVCDGGHRFDVARQGYVNLLRRAAPENADTPEMLAARDRFLGAGHYAPIAAAVADLARGAGRIVEVGAGTVGGDLVSTAVDLEQQLAFAGNAAHLRLP